MTDYKSMFEQAVRTLAAIDEALGIGDDGCGDPEQTLDAIACMKSSPISEEAMDILRAENEKLKTEVEEFAVLTSRLARQLKKAAPDNELPGKVADYLKRTGRKGSPLREVGAGRTATLLTIEDGPIFKDAWRYRVMVENGAVPTQWHEIISEQREGFRARADAAFDDFVSEELSDYEYGEHAP